MRIRIQQDLSITNTLGLQDVCFTEMFGILKSIWEDWGQGLTVELPTQNLYGASG